MRVVGLLPSVLMATLRPGRPFASVETGLTLPLSWSVRVTSLAPPSISSLSTLDSRSLETWSPVDANSVFAFAPNTSLLRCSSFDRSWLSRCKPIDVKFWMWSAYFDANFFASSRAALYASVVSTPSLLFGGMFGWPSLKKNTSVGSCSSAIAFDAPSNAAFQFVPNSDP